MKSTNEIRLKTCPRCGGVYSGAPALSRQGHQTPICPDCGTREALESLGVGAEEQESILETIHRSQRERS
nr:MAG TPA: hypothetical protein [Caudoviricetes sp.]